MRKLIPEADAWLAPEINAQKYQTDSTQLRGFHVTVRDRSVPHSAYNLALSRAPLHTENPDLLRAFGDFLRTSGLLHRRPVCTMSRWMKSFQIFGVDFRRSWLDGLVEIPSKKIINLKLFINRVHTYVVLIFFRGRPGDGSH